MTRILLVGSAFALFVLVGCADEALVDPGLDARDDAATAARAAAPTVSVPFEATFFTDLAAPLAPNARCGDFPPYLFNIQEGLGEASHLGRFTTQITFCVDATDLLEDGLLSEGESLPYDQGAGTFTAANGDELYITISGAVLPSDRPEFDFEFADPFEFAGGTGRFYGASGTGLTNSFVDNTANRTYHTWTGTLTFRPGVGGRR